MEGINDFGMTESSVVPPSLMSPRTFMVHAMLLLIVLLALVPLIDNGRFAIPDEGIYTAQADNISKGAWAQERPTATIDRNGDWFVVSGSLFVGDDAIPYARRPLYPQMLAPFFGPFGTAGGFALSVIGSWIAACAAAGLAADLKRRAVLPTLWLVGLGSPLIFDAFLIVGHSWAAAFAGLCAWGLVRAKQQRASAFVTAAWVGVAFIAAAMCVLVRSEGVLAVLSLALAVFLVAAFDRALPRSRRGRQAGVASLLAVVAAGAYVLNDVWSKQIAAGTGVDPTTSERAPDFLAAMWTGLLQPWFPNNTAANASMALVLVASVVAPVVFRCLPRFRLLAFGLLGLASISAFYRAWTDPSLISGLLPATPWIVVGLLSLRRKDIARTSATVLALSTTIATMAILATSYGVGGAVEWGGRFFLVLIPWVGALAVVGLLEIEQSLSRREWMVTATAIGVMTVSLSVIALRSNVALRADTQRIVDFVEEVRDGALAGPVVFSTNAGDGTPRMVWQLSSADRPVLTADGLINLALLLDTLPSDVGRIEVLTDIPTTKMLEPVVKNARQSRWTITSRTDGPETAYVAYTLERQGD